MDPIIPPDRILAEHHRPVWATESLPSSEAVTHLRRPSAECFALDDADGQQRVTPEVTQSDSIVHEGDRVRLVRDGEPVLWLDGTRYTLAQARAVAAAIVELTDAVEGVRTVHTPSKEGSARSAAPKGVGTADTDRGTQIVSAPDDPCVVCGAHRDEHTRTNHAWTDER